MDGAVAPAFLVGRATVELLICLDALGCAEIHTGGRRVDSSGLLNDKRIIVIDNPKSVVPNVETITVEDDGSDAPVREYHRVEKRMDIEITEFDGEGLVSPWLASHLDPLNYKGHPHHSFQIRLPYIKGVVHEVDFRSLFYDLGVHMIVDIWGNWHSIEDVDMILTKSMFKGFGWMTENGLTWAEYLARCLKYDHALYVSGMDSVEPQDMTELNYQFLNTAAISDEEFRPAVLPKDWYYSRQAREGCWLTKVTEQAYYEFIQDIPAQRDYFLTKLEDPELDINDRQRYRAQLIEKNFWFLFEPIYQKELRDKAAHILSKYRNANLLVAEVNDHLKAQTPKGFPETLLPMLMQHYLSHGGEKEEWLILPVSAVDAYYGSTTFSRKKKTLPKGIIEFKEAYGICKFKMTL